MNTTALVEWYRLNHRSLPWRETHDPYRIWLSEVILQQTRVAQGLEYYNRFTERFPAVADLANATEDDVLKLWQGLGYYSRARNLHAAARQVMERHGGVFPATYDEVHALKGVGDYTAAAVVSFSSDAPYAVVDGNVYRVLARLFDLDTPTDSTIGKKEFAALAQNLLGEYLTQSKSGGAGVYNQAIMELGALVCTPKSPDCTHCPVAGSCLALKNKATAERPVKLGKTLQTPRYFNYLHLTDAAGYTVLCRREGKDIWQGLYEFPLIELPEPVDFDTLYRTEVFQNLVNGADYTLEESVAMPKHVLSHRIIHAVFHRIGVADLSVIDLPANGRVVLAPEISDYGIARLTDLYLSRAGVEKQKGNAR